VSDFSHYRDLRSTVLLDSQGFEVECEAWNLLTLQMILFIFCFLFWWVCSLDPFWSFEDYGVCGH
jgi:hypothetical protein